MTGDIFVNQNASLEISPGTEILFGGNYTFTISGLLIANGNVQDSIKFSTSPGITEWGGFEFTPSSDDFCRLSFCSISKSTNTGIRFSNSNTTLEHCLIFDNQGSTGGGINVSDGSNLQMDSSAVENNYTIGNGGGICTNNANSTITNSIIDNNSSDDGGGGIYYSNNYHTIINSSVSDNIAENYTFNSGGGIQCFNTGTVNIDSCEINNNNTIFKGGGLYLIGSTVNVMNSKIQGNICEHWDRNPSEGGGIKCEDSDLSIDNSEICDNSGDYGGGIDCESSTLTIDSCEINDNYSVEEGGLIISSSTFTMTNSYITGNWTEDRTGGLSYSSDSAIISNCVFNGNIAEDCGGALTVNGDGMSLINCTFYDNYSPICGGLYLWYTNLDLEVKNTIFYANENGAVYYPNLGGNPFSYCDFYNNLPENFTGSPPALLGQLVTVNANGDSCDLFKNILLNPEFYSTTGDSAFRLTADSPCIDAGDPSFPFDPDSTITDMGAFYYDQNLSTIKNGGISEMPDSFILLPNFPNPFNPETAIRFGLPEFSRVRLSIYDILGREIAIITDKHYPPGYHSIAWDAGRNPSGIYFARFTAGDFTQAQKLLLIK